MPLASKPLLTSMAKYLKAQPSAVLSDRQNMPQPRLHSMFFQGKAPLKDWLPEYWYTSDSLFSVFHLVSYLPILRYLIVFDFIMPLTICARHYISNL